MRQLNIHGSRMRTWRRFVKYLVRLLKYSITGIPPYLKSWRKLFTSNNTKLFSLFELVSLMVSLIFFGCFIEKEILSILIVHGVYKPWHCGANATSKLELGVQCIVLTLDSVPPCKLCWRNSVFWGSLTWGKMNPCFSMFSKDTCSSIAQGKMK